jgi:YegS/Rv2252/BmrU family lipid kinase
MAAPYACVIVNPASANGATGRRWPQIRAALDRTLDRWDNQFTLAPGDATHLARSAVQDGYEMIVSIGGDGTMSEVVTGLFKEDGSGGITGELLRKDVILASVRQGTGGDFARYLGLSGNLPDSVAHLGGDRTRSADLGLIEYIAHDGKKKRTAFLNIASFGLSGVVDEKVNTTSKALGGKVSFLVGLGRAFVAYRPQAVKITVDGTPFHEGPMITCAVANGQYFGGGMRFAPKAEIDDGMFDVVAQLRSGLKEVVSIGDLYSGKVADWASVRYTKGRVVRAEPMKADDRVLLDIDGEQLGRLPAEMQMVPSAVRLKV